MMHANEHGMNIHFHDVICQPKIYYLKLVFLNAGF